LCELEQTIYKIER